MADTKFNAWKSLQKSQLNELSDPSSLEAAIQSKLSEGVLGGLNKDSGDWKNIQDVIRASLKSLTEVVGMQAQAYERLRHDMSELRGNNQLKGEMEAKLDRKEFQASVNKLNESICMKVDLHDFKAEIAQYASLADFDGLKRTTELKFNELEAQFIRREEFDEIHDEFANMHKKISQLQSLLNSKIDKSQVMAQQAGADDRFQSVEKKFQALDDHVKLLSNSAKDHCTREEVNALFDSAARQVG